jgi:hypothetical protein
MLGRRKKREGDGVRREIKKLQAPKASATFSMLHARRGGEGGTERLEDERKVERWSAQEEQRKGNDGQDG